MYVPFLAFLSGLYLLLQAPRSLQAQPSARPGEAASWTMSEADVKAYFRVEYFKDKNALKAGNPGGDQVKQIKRLVHAFLSQLTYEVPANLPRVVDRLLADLHFVSTTPAARTIAMDEVVAVAPDLLKSADALVRYNMLAVLVQMSVKQAVIQGGVETPAVPFNAAQKVLIQVIQDKDQILSNRILAARGLRRICRDGENAPSSNEKSDIATALVNTLADNPSDTSDGIWWFRLRLIEALGAVDRIDNSATQPIVLEALLGVIMDQKEVWLNRAVAAQSISQLPYSSSTNIQLITSEVMKLLAEISQEYNKAPSSLELRDSFKHIYLAFRPAQQKQAKEKKWGLLYQLERSGLGAQAAYVKGAWAAAYPVLRPFLESGVTSPQIPAIPSAELKALADWIQQNPSSNRRVMPNGKEFPAISPEPQAAVGATTE